MKTLSLAFRNLLRNPRRTGLTAAAIAFGLALMLFNITLATGSYRAMLDAGISTLAGHVVLEHPKYGKEAELEQLVPDASQKVAAIQQRLPDARITPRIQLGGLLNSPTSSVGTGLRGMVPSVDGPISQLSDKVVAGAWLADDDDRGIVLGASLAEQLSVEVGDKVVFMGQGLGDDVESRLFRVRALFETGSAEQDGFVAVATVAAVQELVGREDAVHQIAVHLAQPERADTVAAELQDLADPETKVMAWRDAIPGLVGMIAADRVSNDFLMAIIGLIVAMGVLNTVLMSVLERTREFGVLLAVGMRPRRVAALVLTEGLLLGLLGAALGAILGVAVSWPLVTYGLDMREMMGETMSTEGITISTLIMGAWDVPRMLQYLAMGALFTVLAAVYPAWHISRLTPVEAMNRG